METVKYVHNLINFYLLMATNRRPRNDIKADRELVSKIDALKPFFGVKSRTGVIAALIRLVDSKAEAPVATTTIFEDTRPILIIGPSGSGKTTTAKHLIEGLNPVLVITPTDEYNDFTYVPYGSLAGFDWSQEGQFTVKLSPDVMISKVEGSLTFRQLNLAMPSGLLKTWIVVVEEAHRFLDDPELKALILEARKYTRKVLILTADPGPLEKLAPVYRPQSAQPSITLVSQT